MADAEMTQEVGEQYASAHHQGTTAEIGMWLFLASEVLFFGSLIFLYLIYRHLHTGGFTAAIRHTELAIGTINTVLLVTSSFVFALGTEFVRAGRTRAMRAASLIAALLGLGFLGLKAVEYHKDFEEHLFPNAHFAITGAQENGAKLFFAFYFGATAIHILHLVIGIGLVGWMLLHTPSTRRATENEVLRVEMVGLYWSFVDIVWITLYPLIYLVGRG